ncbi:MAG: DUF4112 domain-containing protein [Polyangiaceae bacterium]
MSPRRVNPNVVVAPPRWTETLARLLDTAFVVPGTQIRFGFDALLGLVFPGAADAATALITASFIWVGFRQGVPKVILLRMLFNLGIDAVVGTIPVVGDVFDVFHRAATQNLQLLRKHAGGDIQPGWGDYAFVSGVFLILAGLIALPLFLLAGAIYAIVAWAK